MPPINFTDPRFWLDAIQWLVLGVIGLVTWSRKPGEDAGKHVAMLEGRMAVIEERTSHMPTSEELAELEGMVRALEAAINAQEQAAQHRMAGMSQQLNRIESYLLNQRP